MNVSMEAFSGETKSALTLLMATMRLALRASARAEEADKSRDTDVMSNLSDKQRGALGNVLRKLGLGLLTASRRAETEHSHVGVSIRLDNIRDPEVRAAFRTVQAQALNHVLLHADDYNRRAAYVSANSAFEIFCLQIFESFYRRVPRAIPGDPQISLSDAIAAESLDSVIDRIAHTAVRTQLGGAIESWLPRLLQHCGIRLVGKPSEWDAPWKGLCKASAVRNCLIHSGGRVDDKFIQRMAALGNPVAVKVGQITVSHAVITRAVAGMLRAATVIYYGLSANQFNDVAVKMKLRDDIAESFWVLVEEGFPGIASEMIGQNLATSDWTPAQVDELQVARWVARWMTEGESEVKMEASEASWPNTPDFKLQRASLTGDPEAVLGTLRSLISEGSLGALDVIYRPEFFLARHVTSSDRILELKGPGLDVGEDDDLEVVTIKTSTHSTTA